jgi:hypothetical protein
MSEKPDEFAAVARSAIIATGANKIVAALLTLAHWTGGNTKDLPDLGRDDVLATFKAMLADIEKHDSERGL